MKSHIVEAIAVLAELPEDRQVVVVRAILDCATEESSAYLLQDEERSEVLDGLAEIERCEIASAADVTKAYRRLGLRKFATRAALWRRSRAYMIC